MLPLLAACYTLDDVPIVEGYHCAQDAYGLVLEVLDGDTIVVFLTDPLTGGDGSATSGEDGNESEGDTGEPEDTSVLEDSGETEDTGSSNTGDSTEDGYIVNVRLLGVDAPEIAHNESEEADCYGDTSADFLRDALVGETIILSRDSECQDMYGRELGYVLLAPGNNEWIFDCDDVGNCNVSWDLSGTAQVLMNDVVIRSGYAKVYEEFDNIRLASVLYESQDAAQSANVGLWAECE